MRRVPFALAAVLLAGCVFSPEPYAPNPRPYTIPVPELPAPVTEAPLPEPPSYTMLPPLAPELAPELAPAPEAGPVLPEATPQDLAAPAPAADPDARRDPVEDVLLKPPADVTPTPAAAQAAPPSVTAPGDASGAVPLMGFRPMRGQKSPGA